MNPQEFQAAHSTNLKAMLETPWGKEFFQILSSVRPGIADTFPSESAMIRSYAKNEGYELCLRNILGLTIPPAPPVAQPEANYGVPTVVKPTE